MQRITRITIDEFLNGPALVERYSSEIETLKQTIEKHTTDLESLTAATDETEEKMKAINNKIDLLKAQETLKNLKEREKHFLETTQSTQNQLAQTMQAFDNTTKLQQSLQKQKALAEQKQALENLGSLVEAKKENDKALANLDDIINTRVAHGGLRKKKTTVANLEAALDIAHRRDFLQTQRKPTTPYPQQLQLTSEISQLEQQLETKIGYIYSHKDLLVLVQNETRELALWQQRNEQADKNLEMLKTKQAQYDQQISEAEVILRTSEKTLEAFALSIEPGEPEEHGTVGAIHQQFDKVSMDISSQQVIITQLAEESSAKDETLVSIQASIQTTTKNIDWLTKLPQDDRLNDLDQKQLETRKAALTQAPTQIQAAITKATLECRDKSSKLDALKKKLDKAAENQFLSQLRDNPQLLFSKLVEDIQTINTRFNQTFPANQSWLSRVYLVKIQDHIDFLQTSISRVMSQLHSSTDEGLKATQHSARSAYFEIAGHLYHAAFSPDVITVAQTHSVQKNLLKFTENLPFTINDCIAHEDLKKLTQDYDVNPAAWNDKEKAEYKAAHQALLNQVIANPYKSKKLIDHQLKIANRIQHKANTEGDAFDYKFYTTVLNATAELLANPSDQNLQKNYYFLAQQDKNEQPSTKKKVFGVMLALLGLILGIANALIPPSPSSIPLIASSALLLGSGSLFFRSGMRKGASKEMMAMLKTAKTIKQPQPHDDNAAPLLQYVPYDSTKPSTQLPQYEPFDPTANLTRSASSYSHRR